MKARTSVGRSVPKRLPAARPLFIIRSAIALLVTAIFSIALSEPPAAAQARPDVLSANIDSTVSPRDDFFQYANGQWLNRNPIPEDQARWGISNLVSQDIYEQLRRISEDAAAKKAPRGT